MTDHFRKIQAQTFVMVDKDKLLGYRPAGGFTKAQINAMIQSKGRRMPVKHYCEFVRLT